MEEKKYSFDFLKDKLGEDTKSFDELSKMTDEATKIMFVMYSSLRKSGFDRDEAIAVMVTLFKIMTDGETKRV